MSTIATAMESKIVPILDDKIIIDELERLKRAHPDFSFDTSFALDGSSGNSEGEYVFDFEPDESNLPADEVLPDVEAMRAACASGNLMTVQSVFKTYWLDRPVNDRIDKDLFGARGLCEAIKRDDATIGSYLLSNVVSLQEGHFTMATECHSYSFLQLCVDRGWDINTCLSRWTPPALS